MNINIYGPANNLGTGVHTLGMVKALDRMGYMIRLLPPFGNVSVRDKMIDKWLENASAFDPRDTSLMIFDIVFFPHFTGTPRIGFAVFETDGFTPRQLSALRSVDRILTPSKWGHAILEQHGFNASIVNEGYDPDVYPVSNEIRDRLFTFGNVGKLEERKGTIQTVHCFTRALEGKAACLMLHCENPFLGDWRMRIHDALVRLGYFLWDEMTYKQGYLVVRVIGGQADPINYHKFDCGLFPSRGEAWGLPILECLASGVPVVTGRWTGMEEYINRNYPPELLLRDAGLETANDGVWFHGDRGNWHVMDDEDLCARILWAFGNARTIMTGNEFLESVKFSRQFTWDAAARTYDKLNFEV